MTENLSLPAADPTQRKPTPSELLEVLLLEGETGEFEFQPRWTRDRAGRVDGLEPGGTALGEISRVNFSEREWLELSRHLCRKHEAPAATGETPEATCRRIVRVYENNK